MRELRTWPLDQSSVELGPPEPLRGRLRVEGRNGNTVTIEGATVDGSVEVAGHLVARRHLECRLIEGVAMMTGLGSMARVPRAGTETVPP
jgi:hypothetical protein